MATVNTISNTLGQFLHAPFIAFGTNLSSILNNSSFIVYEGPQLALNGNLYAKPNAINLNQNATLTGINAIGGSGTGNYIYQWIGQKYNKATNSLISAYINCYGGPMSNAMKFVFEAGCNVTPGTYQFELKATDSLTGVSVTSAPVRIVVNDNPTIPYSSNMISYVPITIYNNQSIATPVPWQQMVRINSSKYYSQGLINSNLSNVEFFYKNGTVVPSWLEFAYRFYLNASSYDSIYWLNIAKGIPANGDITVYMGFAPTNQVLINNANDGVNPYLFSSLNYNYDDGRNVFPFYDNLQGTTFDMSEWKTNYAPISQTYNALYNLTYVNYYSNTILAKNDGIFIRTGAASLYSTAAYGQGNVISAWALASRAYNYPFIGFGFYQNTSYAGAVPSVGYYSGGSNSYLYGGSAINPAASGPCGGDGGCSYSIYNISYVGSNAYWSWYGPASLIQIPAAGGSASLSNNTYNGAALPMGFWGTQGPGYPYYSELIMVRDRYSPPNNVMPAATVGGILSTITPTNTFIPVIFNGIPVNVAFASSNAFDHIQMTIGDPLVTVNGIGTVSYTICSAPSTCLPPGYYDIAVNDISTSSIENWTLVINPPPNVIATPANSILDQGQQMYLTSNAVNGTGIFDYQWYNLTSGSGVAIANQINALMLFNATNSGTFKYYVGVNDVGTNTVYSVQSNIITINVKPTLAANAMPSNIRLAPGSILSINSVVTGGTGNFVYQWYNFSSGIFPVAMANQISNSIILPFNSIGNFSYFIAVTDQGTTTSPRASALSIPASISVSSSCGAVTPGINAIACIPISIQNTQGNIIASNTQIAFPFSAGSYETYEASNMMNVFLYNSLDGNAASCWLEGNSTNEAQTNALYSSSSLLYWCKIPDAIGSSTDNNWYIGFAPTTTDLYANTIARLGAAPQLYCAGPYNCPASSYAGADNGNAVFLFYDNFSGTILRSIWSNPDSSTIVVNDGLTLDKAVSIGCSGNGGEMQSSASFYSPGNTIDYYGEIQGGSSGSWSSAGLGFFSSPTTCGGTPQGEVDWGSGEQYYRSEPTSSDSNIGFSSAQTVWSTGSNPYGTMLYYSQGYASTSSQPASSTLSSGDIVVYQQANSAGAATATWIRVRATPTNDIGPTVSYGQLINPYASISFGSNPISSNTATTVTAHCLDTDSCAVQSTLGASLCLGTGSCTYTTNALSAGSYTYYANDITRDSYVSGMLNVFSACNSQPSGINAIVCIPINIQNTQTAAVASNTQIALSFPANLYETYEASNMMNVFVYNSVSASAAPCWLEGNTLSETQAHDLYASANLLYWCRIPDAIAPSATDSNWYFGIASNSVDLYANTIARLGAAPQLYCAGPYNCPASSYAGADNGNAVFNFYDNFSGSSLSSKWTSDISNNGASLTIDNGAAFVSGTDNGASIGSTSPYSYGLGNVLDSLAYMYDTGSGNGYMKIFLQLWDGTFDQSESAPSTGYGGLFLPEGSYGWTMQVHDGGSDPTSSPSYATGSYDVESNWASPSNVVVYQNYLPLASSNGLSLGGTGRLYLSVEGGTSTQSSMDVQWVRLRTAPPNDVLPTVTLGSSGSAGAMLVMRSTAPYIGASPPSSPYTMTVLTKCPSAGARIPNVIIPSNVVCPYTSGSAASNSIG